MTIVGLAGIIFGLLSLKAAFVRSTRLRLYVFFFAYVVHIGTTLLYHSLVSDGSADAGLYYFDWGRHYDNGFGMNTQFIIYIVQSIKLATGGSYLDLFLIFQAFGFFGIVILMRIFEEIYDALGIEQPLYTYGLFLLPSIHYWTSAIGKDALFFLAITLALWASMQFKRRVIALVIAMLILVVIRPHIALISLVAFTLAVLIDRHTPFAVRLLLFVGGLIGTGFAVASVWNTFAVDLTNVDVYSDMLAGAGRDAVLQSDSAGNTAVTGSYPVRLLSLLFRPFFFDAPGALGLIVSLENALLLFMLVYLVFQLPTSRSLLKQVPSARYALVSSVGILLVLTLGYYNVGLGIRQKATMILPGLLVFFVTARALIEAQRQHAPAGTAAGELVHA